MASLKRWWFERSIKPQAHQSHYFHGRSNQRIGIITDTLDDLDRILSFMKREKANGNTPSCLAFCLDKNVPADLPDGTITKKEIKWPGIPQSQIVDEFLSTNFDAFYVFVNQASLPVEYILRSVKSGLKLGYYHKTLTPYLDFCVDVNEMAAPKRLDYLLEASNKLLFGKKKPA